MADDLGGFASRARGLAAQLGGAGARGITTAVLAAGKDAALEALRADLPSQRLSHLGRRGLKLNVGYDLTGPASGQVKLRPRGAWLLLSDGAKRHPIGMRRRTRSGRLVKRKGSGPPLLNFTGNDDDWITGPVWHPGTAGKGTLATTITRLQEVVPRTYAELLDGLWEEL